MIYEFKCPVCQEKEIFNVPLSEHSTIVRGARCIDCGAPAVQVISVAKPIIRSSFPKNFVHEHISAEPIKLRDEKHFRDVCKENGFTPTNPWDGI